MGSLQADLVLHCGESTEGFFLTTLCAVDVAVVWTELQPVWGMGKQRVGSAMYHIRQRLLWGGKMSSAFFSLRRYPLIFVVKTAQNRPSDDLASRWRAGPSRRPRGALKTECAMRPGTVVVRYVLSQYPPGVPLIDDDHVVQTLPTQFAYDPFGNGVSLGCLDRGKDGLDTDLACPWFETPSIAAVPITNEVLRLLAPRGGLD